MLDPGGKGVGAVGGRWPWGQETGGRTKGRKRAGATDGGGGEAGCGVAQGCAALEEAGGVGVIVRSLGVVVGSLGVVGGRLGVVLDGEGVLWGGKGTREQPDGADKAHGGRGEGGRRHGRVRREMPECS